jgi:predicted ATP-grasp superfamily ATP-dependent carboligase
MTDISTKKNILVFPCGSEIGLELYKSLCFSTHFRLFGGSSVDDHGKYVYSRYIGDMPRIDDSEFISQLNTIIREHKIDFIFPAHDSVVLLLAKEQDAGNLACTVITSSAETAEIARSKLKTYTTLKEAVRVPNLFNPADVQPSDLPVFLKPDVGQGSKGVYLAKELSDITFFMKKDPTLLVMEYLPGKEYTVDCFTDKTGALLFSEGRERKRISNGISVNSERTHDERFTRIAHSLNEMLKFRGVWFFQVKENRNDELVLMEIAPRVAGTMGLVRCNGVNLPLLSLFDAMNDKISIFENQNSMIIDRALQNTYRHNISYSHVYLDLDDLVIFEKKVNPAVMAFVYQCLNNGVRVHLLTKHKSDLHETLKKYRLNDIFDSIIWIESNYEKHLKIIEKNAILIDDSFSERQQVHSRLGIPTFDAHALESLMEPFKS